MTQVFFLLHCQAMRLVHHQTAKHSDTLRRSLKRHLMKLYLPNTCSVLLKIIYITAWFAEWCVAVELLTKEKKREVNLQEVHVRAP